MPDFRRISGISQLKAILLTESPQGLLATFKDKFLEGQSPFRGDLNNPQEIEHFLLEERYFFGELLRGVVANLSNDVSEFVVELLFLPEK